MKLTLKELSHLSKEKRQILSFIFNDMYIKLLPPLKSKGGIYVPTPHHSVIINNLDASDLTEELKEKWYDTRCLSMFKNDFYRLMHFDKFKIHEVRETYGKSKLLREHLVNIENAYEYHNKYNVIYKEPAGEARHEVFELTENRAIDYITLSKNKAVVRNIKLLQQGKKQLKIIS
jgi:hypothetical protein